MFLLRILFPYCCIDVSPWNKLTACDNNGICASSVSSGHILYWSAGTFRCRVFFPVVASLYHSLIASSTAHAIPSTNIILTSDLCHCIRDLLFALASDFSSAVVLHAVPLTCDAWFVMKFENCVRNFLYHLLSSVNFASPANDGSSIVFITAVSAFNDASSFSSGVALSGVLPILVSSHLYTVQNIVDAVNLSAIFSGYDAIASIFLPTFHSRYVITSSAV